MNDRIAKLEVKRVRLHDYIIMKLEERDYHGVADAAMDLRELQVECRMLEDEHNQLINSRFAWEAAKRDE